MEYVCDAPHNRTWFRLMTEGEAISESLEMKHAVEKHYRRERDRAAEAFQPRTSVFIEQDIGKEDHIRRSMPMFLTLRDEDGKALVTAMLPQKGRGQGGCIIVGPGNADPYPEHADAIRALAEHFGLTLDRSSCYPYRR
ncbi:MAG: hypothetical protein B7Z80_24850 [Rhodospirillales bacterium 20-64-7]|nr:MAG: hypothetical protein B7Z80_24850 [Rhodospirillales bacterium 20-64-7]HQT77270.1 hypothetical protein [Rhodopila sp.]